MEYYHRRYWEEIEKVEAHISSYIRHLLQNCQIFHYFHLAMVKTESGDAF